MPKVGKALLPISPIGKRPNQAGFTLLELMLVVLVVGLLSGAVAHTLLPPQTVDVDRQIQVIRHYLHRVQQRAVFSSTDLGVLFTPYELVTLRYEEKGWVKEADTRPLVLARELSLELLVDGQRSNPLSAKEIPNVTPQLFFFSDGHYSNFQLELSGTDHHLQLNGLRPLRQE